MTMPIWQEKGWTGEALIEPSGEERTLATLVMRTAERMLGLGPLLFGRVDLVRDTTGELRLMELELTEPLLHLEYNEEIIFYDYRHP